MSMQQHYGGLFAGMLLSIGAVLAACHQSTPEQPHQAPPQVVVETAQAGAFPLAFTYTARTAGSREIEVRARVSGILQKRLYQEGAWVDAQTPLFLIDPEPFKAAVAQARADLALERAKYAQAERAQQRIMPLFAQGLASAKERDDAISNFDIAAASVQAAAARLRTNTLELSYAEVRAPISGLTSRESKSEGSLLMAGNDASLLTRIVQVQPLYVEFSLPEQEAALLRTQLHTQTPVVKVILNDGTPFDETASLTFIDNAVEMGSGMITARAVLPNQNKSLLPGQFVRVFITGVTLQNVVAIQRKSAVSTAQGYMVWVVDQNNKAGMRPVQLGHSEQARVVVLDGLAVGERYITDGLMKVYPGIEVSPIKAAVVAETHPTTPAVQTVGHAPAS